MATLVNAYQSVFRLGNFFTKAWGVDIFAPCFKPNLAFVNIFIDSTTYVVINFLNIFMFYDNLLRLCFCLVTYTFGFQGIARLYCGIENHKNFKQLSNRTQLYNRFGNDELEEEAAFIYYGKLVKIIANLFTCAFIGTGIVSLLYPLPEVFTTGKPILPFGFVIPGTNYENSPGYEINYFYHVIQAYFTVTGFLGFQLIYVACILYLCFQSELIQIKIRKFGYKANLQNLTNFEAESKVIFKLYHDFLTYHMMLEEQYNVILGFDIICVPFQTIVTLVVCTETMWLPGYGIMFSAAAVLFFGSALGVFVEIKCEELSNTIYSFPWYLIKAKNRKNWRFFLEASQNINRLSCGGFLPLNFNTFLQTYKTVYSTLMFLLRMQN